MTIIGVDPGKRESGRELDIFVEGEPQPFPKKATSRTTGMIYSVDKDGSKRGWMQAIRLAAKEAWGDKPIFDGKYDCLCLNLTFFRTKPRSATKKLQYPNTRPDVDNYAYCVTNALIGVCYCDDSRVVDILASKRFADDNSENDRQPGVAIALWNWIDWWDNNERAAWLHQPDRPNKE